MEHNLQTMNICMFSCQLIISHLFFSEEQIDSLMNLLLESYMEKRLNESRVNMAYVNLHVINVVFLIWLLMVQKMWLNIECQWLGIRYINPSQKFYINI